MATNTLSQPQTQATPINHDEWLRRLGIVFALVGIGISLYLTYVKLSDSEIYCAETSVIDCEGVQNSSYAELFGIPVAILGLFSYGGIALMFGLQNRIGLLRDFGYALLFSITLFGFIYSLFLTYVEGFILEKWCMWCVASALTMTSLFLISLARLVISMSQLDDEPNP